MKNNTTLQRIYNPFSYPPVRFTKAVETVIDEYGGGSGSDSEVSYGGSISGTVPDAIAPYLTADNLGKIYDLADSLVVQAGSNEVFVEDTFDTETTLPAHCNLLVVNTGSDTEPVYRFDILPGTGGGGLTEEEVSDIADRRIVAYHTEHGNGLTEEEVIALVQAAIEDGTIETDSDSVSYGGSLDFPDTTLLIEDNFGKIYNIDGSFTVKPGDASFLDTFDKDTTFPAGTNVIVVANSEGAYCFDILHGLASATSSTILMYESNNDTISIDDSEEIDLTTDLISWRVQLKVTSPDGVSDLIDGGEAVCRLTDLYMSGLIVFVMPGAQSMLGYDEETTIEVSNIKIYVKA